MTPPIRPGGTPAAGGPRTELPAAARLELWEGGAGGGPFQRDLAVLRSAFPDAGPETLGGLALGRRNAALLDVYEATFGPRFDGILDCAGCGEVLELSIDVARLRADRVPPSGTAPDNAEPDNPGPDNAEPDEWIPITVGGYEILFRLPDSTDMMAAAAADSPGAARAELAGRVLRAWRDGVPALVDRLPSDVLGAALAAMTGHDPLAETLLHATCPLCGTPATALLDVGAFLWTRVEASARTLLWEVSMLARAYGWSEPEILALGPRRRARYLELIQ